MIIDFNRLLSDYELPRDSLAKAKLSAQSLEAIYARHSFRVSELERIASRVANDLRRLRGAHEVAWRVKDGRGLIAKIIRKRIDDSTRNITLETYDSEITDLIGLRVMHLEKSVWSDLHATIVDAFEHHEAPVLHIAEGDDTDSSRLFEDVGLEVKASPAGYRSIHYVVRIPGVDDEVLAEIQLRTMFENAWGEIDHERRYPTRAVDERVQDELRGLSKLAHTADQLTTSIYDRSANLTRISSSPTIIEKLASPSVKSRATTSQSRRTLIEHAVARVEGANSHRVTSTLRAGVWSHEFVAAGHWFPVDQLELRFRLPARLSGPEALDFVVSTFGPQGLGWLRQGDHWAQMFYPQVQRLLRDLPLHGVADWLDGNIGGVLEYQENGLENGEPACVVVFSEQWNLNHPFLDPSLLRQRLLDLKDNQLYLHSFADELLQKVDLSGDESHWKHGRREVDALVRLGYLQAVPRHLIPVAGMNDEIVLAFELTAKGRAIRGARE